jgi:hypothetical protein
MRLEEECLAKADEMEDCAQQADSAAIRIAFLDLAQKWRHLASITNWQAKLNAPPEELSAPAENT